MLDVFGSDKRLALARPGLACRAVPCLPSELDVFATGSPPFSTRRLRLIQTTHSRARTHGTACLVFLQRKTTSPRTMVSRSHRFQPGIFYSWLNEMNCRIDHHRHVPRSGQCSTSSAQANDSRALSAWPALPLFNAGRLRLRRHPLAWAGLHIWSIRRLRLRQTTCALSRPSLPCLRSALNVLALNSRLSFSPISTIIPGLN